MATFAAGSIRNRSGDPFKPSTIRSYEQALEKRVLRELGAARISELRHADLQDFAERLLADGLDPSTIRNALMPLRAIYRRALARGEVAVNPTAGLMLPAVRGRRDRIVSPEEAARLLAGLCEGDRALWATALYAGLRRGELMALRFEDVDLEGGVIRVARSWDAREGVVEPKSRPGTRSVPIAAVLREHLAARGSLSSRSASLRTLIRRGGCPTDGARSACVGPVRSSREQSHRLLISTGSKGRQDFSCSRARARGGVAQTDSRLAGRFAACATRPSLVRVANGRLSGSVVTASIRQLLWLRSPRTPRAVAS